jgi:hypothetical protein
MTLAELDTNRGESKIKLKQNVLRRMYAQGLGTCMIARRLFLESLVHS